jgi:hypothetical protein
MNPEILVMKKMMKIKSENSSPFKKNSLTKIQSQNFVSFENTQWKSRDTDSCLVQHYRK